MDVLLSALPPQTQVQAAPASTSATATRPQLPQAIANLPKGTLIEGFVVNRDASGNPILRTDKGDVLVKSELFLKTGSEVLIRLSAASMDGSAKIVSVDKQPIEQLLQQQQAAAKTPHGSATRESVSAPNAPLQAVLIKPATYGSAAQSQQTIASILRLPAAMQPLIEQGMKLSFQLAASPVLPPAGSALASGNAAPSGSANLATTLPAAPQAPAAPPTSANTLYGAYQKTAANAPPSSAAPSSASGFPAPAAPGTQAATATQLAAGAVTLNATVIGNEGTQTVLKTPIGTIKLYTPAPLPTGSLVPLIFASDAAPMANQASVPITANQSLPPASVLAGTLPHDWEALREAMQLLAGNQAGAAAQSGAGASELAARIPNTKSDLVNSVLFFLSALRSSDLQRWLGSGNAQKIESKNPNLFRRLGGDFAALSSLSTTEAKPDLPWQMLTFPLMHDDALNQARLFWRHERGGEQPLKGEEETRFIFDLEMSELGAVQIDGLVKGKRPECRCDVLIRSSQPLSDADQAELNGLFISASEAAGIAGSLRFTSGKEALLSPLRELREAAAGDEDGSIMA